MICYLLMTLLCGAVQVEKGVKRGGECNSVMEHLPCIRKTLCLNLQYYI